MITGEINLEQAQTSKKTNTDRESSYRTNNTITSRSDRKKNHDLNIIQRIEGDENCARFAIEETESKYVE